MSQPILATKLYIPPPQATLIQRPRLLERLDAGMHRKLTLIAAPAGFGKTTLVSEWVAGCAKPVAWLSLDEGDRDLARLLTYPWRQCRASAPGSVTGCELRLRVPRCPRLRCY
jgi:LuxR family maltose regulon positive regulatory protein